MNALIRWSVGLLVSLALGHVVVAFFLSQLRRKLGLGGKPRTHDISVARVPPWLTGTLERLFFTVLIGSNVSGVPTAMVGWLALKFATNWNRAGSSELSTTRAFAMSALLAGLLSMLFATWGGLICAPS
jgi:hypothetical protein